MKYKELNVALNICEHCGAVVITVNDAGECPSGCSGYMTEHRNEVFSIDLDTGEVSLGITKDQVTQERTIRSKVKGEKG